MIKSIFSRYYLIGILLAGLLGFSGCSESETRVIIFHTNDTHSNLDNFPALSFLVNQERENNKHVLLVSGGDIFSGNPMVDYYDPPGYPKIDLMNRVGYDLNTIGNHEFDYGVEVLTDRIRQARFPFILANINTEGSKLAQPEPYHIIRVGKRKIAFLGVVQLNSQGIPSAHPDNLTGMEFYPPIEKAGEFDYLTERADAVIALTHHGFVSDTLMAALYPWFDVIIGGHSHTLTLEPRLHNGILVTQAGSNMQYAGKVTLLFRGNDLVEKSAEMISLAGVAGRDEAIAAVVEEYNDNDALNRIIGTLVHPLEDKAALGCFITDAYRRFGGFDLAFQNYGGIRVNSLSGEIHVRDIFRMDPFGNELVSMYLNYDELKGLIGNSLSARSEPILQISGGTVEVHLNREGDLYDVKIFGLDGIELDSGSRYLTGMPSYIATAFDFDRDDPGTGMGITTAQVLIDHITATGRIDYSPAVRSRVVRYQP